MFRCHYCGVCVKDGGLIVRSSRYIVGCLMFLTIMESDLITRTYSTTLWRTRNYLAFVRLEEFYQQIKLCQWIYWFCCDRQYKKIRLIAANRSLFAYNKLPSSRLLYRSCLNKWIRKMGSQRQRIKIVIVFFNKVLRNTFGLTIENGIWWIKQNEEIRQQCKDPDLAWLVEVVATLGRSRTQKRRKLDSWEHWMKRAWRQETYRKTQHQIVEQKHKNMRKMLRTESFGDGVNFAISCGSWCCNCGGGGGRNDNDSQVSIQTKNVCINYKYHL